MTGLGAPHHFLHAPAGDETFQPRHERKVRIALRFLHGFDLAGEFFQVSQRLALAVDERIGLWEQLVLDANRGDAALLELAHQPPHVVEVPVSGVRVEQDRDAGRVAHEFHHFEHLRPARFVIVAHAERGGNGEPARPDAAKTRFFDDARAQAVVRFHQEFELIRAQQLAELRRFLTLGLDGRSHERSGQITTE
jgi:hypothetical protein